MKIIKNARFAKVYCYNCGSLLQIDKEKDITKTTKIHKFIGIPIYDEIIETIKCPCCNTQTTFTYAIS